MLKARQGEDIETIQVVQSVAEGMLTITDTQGQDAVEDWEVDELLEWTNGLNFDQYVELLCSPLNKPSPVEHATMTTIITCSR